MAFARRSAGTLAAAITQGTIIGAANLTLAVLGAMPTASIAGDRFRISRLDGRGSQVVVGNTIVAATGTTVPVVPVAADFNYAIGCPVVYEDELT